jgi:hypothetical protein
LPGRFTENWFVADVPHASGTGSGLGYTAGFRAVMAHVAWRFWADPYPLYAALRRFAKRLSLPRRIRERRHPLLHFVVYSAQGA